MGNIWDIYHKLPFDSDKTVFLILIEWSKKQVRGSTEQKNVPPGTSTKQKDLATMPKGHVITKKTL